MKSLANFFFFLLISYAGLANTSFSKLPKVFISEDNHYIQFLNDSVISTSIVDFGEETSYRIKNDSLWILNSYWIFKQKGSLNIKDWHSFKIVFINDDSLGIESKAISSGRVKVITFVSLDVLRESIYNFKYLKLHKYGGLGASRDIFIDSVGKISFESGPQIRVKNKLLSRTRGEFTQKEFLNFLDTLSYSLTSRMLIQRPCGIDASNFDIEIRLNDKTIISTGCKLQWVQSYFLVNYLYNLEKNNGFIKRQKG